MSITIMRRIKFCAGHRLHQHGGKCEYFHGHNYTAEFYITGNEIDTVGRLIDFGVLKQKFKGWLDEHWDHGFVLYENDANGIEAAKIVRPCKYFTLPYNPTAENMALYLLDVVCPQLLAGSNVHATKVVLWETDEAFAAATIDAGANSAVTHAVGTCADD
ncbi:MAG: 6-carboxytetrahydropterin synthase [Planctomycetales bacterium]|nr:6-carboxytetrahydropterin synthase [Planctomycetales bacterium]